MGNMLYVATNLLNSNVVITPTSEDPLFPKTALYDNYPSRKFKFNVAALDDMITIDFGSAKSIDFCSIHGHNLDSGVTDIELRSSNDNFAADDIDEGSLTARDPAMYLYLSSPVSKRYWRVKFVGTNGSAGELGQLCIGAASKPTRNPRHGHEMTEVMTAIRNRTRAGALSVVNLTDFPKREIPFAFRGSFTALEDLRDNLWVALNYGQDPVVVVPDDDRPNVLHGRFRQDLAITRLFAHATPGNELYDYELTLMESAFGVTVTT